MEVRPQYCEAQAPAAGASPERVRRAIARLQALPAFYPTVQKALRLLADPLSSNAQIQQVIATDQAVAARVLRLANTARFGFSSHVPTVALAVTLVGRNRVATLLRRFLTEEMVQMLSGRRPSASRIRKLSIVTAAAAHCMAELLVRPDQEEIHLAGLLHNIGELVLLSQFRDGYGEVVRLAQFVPWPEAERSVFGVESPRVSRWLLEAWDFPEFFLTAVEHWPDPLSVPFPAGTANVLAMLHAARRLAEYWLEDRRSGEIEDAFPDRLLAVLGADRRLLATVYERLPNEVERVRETLV